MGRWCYSVGSMTSSRDYMRLIVLLWLSLPLGASSGNKTGALTAMGNTVDLHKKGDNLRPLSWYMHARETIAVSRGPPVEAVPTWLGIRLLG